MSELVGAQPPGWFRLLAFIGILWDLIGVATYLQKVGMPAIRWPASDERAGQVGVGHGAFAVGVFAGLLGAWHGHLRNVAPC